jgi:hypothetical protein
MVSLIQFVRFHKRLPNKSMSYNDVLHRIKTSDDILDPLRVFVTDKEFLKLYVRAVVGDAYVVPTLDVIKSKAASTHTSFRLSAASKPRTPAAA